MWETILMLLLSSAAIAQQIYLNNAPIVFSLSGTTNYIPNTGGSPIPGYNINVGFDQYSWLGIQFMTPTSGSNWDTLVVQRSLTPSGGLYTCSIQDYYIASGRPTTLMNDRITNLDTVVTTTSKGSSYQLTIPRTIGNTSGEDWEGGQFVQICFFTSSSAFSTNTWSKQYIACFGYQIDNYVSTYRGSNLGNMMFEGVSSILFGGIYGPFLQLQLYWYRSNRNITNTTNMIIRIGSQINEAVGYDYFVCGVGDFYGTDVSNFLSDLDYSGYSNGACTYRTTSSSIQLSYTRDALTYDSYDYTLTSSFQICLIGSQTGCSTISPPILIPSMSVQSALSIAEKYLLVSLLLALSLLLIVI